MFILISSAPINSTPFKAFLAADGDTTHSNMVLSFQVPFSLMNVVIDGLILFLLLFFEDDNPITVSSASLGFPLFNIFGGIFILLSSVFSCFFISDSISGFCFLCWMPWSMAFDSEVPSSKIFWLASVFWISFSCSWHSLSFVRFSESPSAKLSPEH